MRNHSNENEFDLHENGHVGEIHFHINGFLPILVLQQRQRVTRKWPVRVSDLIRVIFKKQIVVHPTFPVWQSGYGVEQQIWWWGRLLISLLVDFACQTLCSIEKNLLGFSVQSILLQMVTPCKTHNS